MVQARPKTPHELSGIKGMGSYRLEKYGAALLAAINNRPVVGKSTPPQPRPTPAIEPNRPLKPATEDVESRLASLNREPLVATEEWTGRLLDRGFSAAEAALIRGIEPAVILRHAEKLVRFGRTIPIEAFVESDILEVWDERLKAGFDIPLPGSQLPPAIWALFLASRRPGHNS